MTEDSSRAGWLLQARSYLRNADPVLARLIDDRPDFDPRAWTAQLPPMDLYGALLFQVTGQQLSVPATRRTLARIQALFGGLLPAPAELLAVDPGRLREAGLSWRKISTLRDLAERMSDGRLDPDALSLLPDDEVMAELTAIPGIGPWTVQGALIIALQREDVVLPGDLALRKAVRAAYQLDHLPAEQEVLAIASKWRPYRSLATSYLFSAAISTSSSPEGQLSSVDSPLEWRPRRGVMAKIVIAGAGVVGLGTGLLLCGDGHEVTVLERDAEAAPTGADEIWGTWQRKGVNQFRLPHFFLARYRGLLNSELPEVKKELVAAGAVRRNPVLDAPEGVKGSAREGDDAFECISGRRCVVEAAVASVAGRAPHLEIRRGAAVAGLVIGPSAHDGVPHVAGVHLSTGEEITADLVVDMTGRRSPLPRWLEEIGARPPRDELDDCGFIYYGRHFRSADGALPPALGGLLMHLGTISALTLPADNGTWSITLVASAKDKALYRLHDAAIWEQAVRSLPLVAHWLDGQPIDDRVIAMAGIEDRHRNLMVDGAPVVTGVVAVGDAWACSNPTVGRGASIGMLQAVLLRDTIAAAGLDDPWEFACSFHHATAEMVEPWYRDTLASDRHRLAEIDALIGGGEYRPRDPGWEIGQALANAAFKDPDCLRGFVSVAMVLSRGPDVMARPGLFDKVIALGAGWRDEPVPAPRRAELLSIVAGD